MTPMPTVNLDRVHRAYQMLMDISQDAGESDEPGAEEIRDEAHAMGVRLLALEDGVKTRRHGVNGAAAPRERQSR